MIQHNIKKEKRQRRHAKIRATVFGTAEKPRLSVFKSNKHISVQLIDDFNSKTLAFAHSKESKAKTLNDKSREVGSLIAKKAKDIKVKKVVFDRGGFKYIGCVKTLADSAREAGLEF